MLVWNLVPHLSVAIFDYFLVNSLKPSCFPAILLYICGVAEFFVVLYSSGIPLGTVVQYGTL